MLKRNVIMKLNIYSVRWIVLFLVILSLSFHLVDRVINPLSAK